MIEGTGSMIMVRMMVVIHAFEGMTVTLEWRRGSQVGDGFGLNQRSRQPLPAFPSVLSIYTISSSLASMLAIVVAAGRL